MKAIVQYRYGAADVLQVKELDKPTPNKNQILVKIIASSVTAADVMMRQGSPKFGRLFIGLLRPKSPGLGTGFSGTIESVGNDVSRFNVGDDVFGEVLFGAGTNAEYVCVEQNELVFAKPNNISHSQAASLGDGALTSMNFLSKVANVGVGDSVLINGASGSLGTAAVQIAACRGAHVTAMCSAANTALVRSLGADQVLDYRSDSLPSELEQYDVIYDTVGKLSYQEYKPFLTQSGVFVSPVLSLKLLADVLVSSLIGCKKAKFSATGMLRVTELRSLYENVKQMVVQGHLSQVMDREFDLVRIADAHRYVETGRKKGNLALLNGAAS